MGRISQMCKGRHASKRWRVFFIGGDKFLSTGPIFRTQGSFDLSGVKQIKNEPSEQSPAVGEKPGKKRFHVILFF